MRSEGAGRIGGLRVLVLLFAVAVLAVACERVPVLSPTATPEEVAGNEVPAIRAELGSPRANRGELTAPLAGNLPAPSRSLQVRFEQVTDERGSTVDSPYAVVQDRLGFLWIGSADGLIRYDGYNLKRYEHDPEDAYSLSNNKVLAVLEDQAGTLWVGTFGGGLSRLDRDRDLFIHYQHKDSDPTGLSDDRIYTLYEDRSGVLWVGTSGGGLNRLDQETGTFEYFRYNPDDPLSLSSDYVNVIYEDVKGVLWVGTNSGLDRFDRQTGQFYHYQHDPNNPASLSSDLVFAILEDHLEGLWVGTNGGGLNYFDRKTEQFTSFRNDPKNPSSLSNDFVFSLLEDETGMVWVGTMGGGVNRFDPRAKRFTRHEHDAADPSSPSGNYVNTIYEDRAGIIWVGTTLTLDKYDPNKEKFSQQFRRDHVVSILEDRSGNLWVGAFDGLYHYDREVDYVTHYRHRPDDPYSISEWWVSAICEDRSGRLWVGTAGGGLNRFDRGTQRFAHYRHEARNPDSLSSDVVNVIYEDSRGVLWVGTDSGLDQLDRQRERFVKFPIVSNPVEPAGAEIVTAILEDGQGSLWIGTQGGGLKRYEMETRLISTYRHDPERQDSLRNNIIYALFEDSVGQIWVGTEGGLHLFDRETGAFGHYGVQDGLPDDEIYGILEDQSGYLWLSTDHGLSKFDPGSAAFRNYDVGDGLQANQFSGAAHRRRNGEMLFGGINGISAFYPDQITDNPYIPPVVLLSLRQDGEEVKVGRAIETLEEVTLSGLKNDFEFEFAALSYSQPEKNEHAYFLEGYDQEWNYIGTNRVARYTNLPGGTYILRLKGANDDGIWSEQGVSVQITVVPPFWETWWFRGVIGLVVVGGVFAAYLMRIKSIQARNIELEGQIVERTREIERSRQELEALYRADEKMHRHLELDQVLQALVDVAVDILHADKSSVFVLDEREERWVIRVARGFNPETVAQLSFSREEGITGYLACQREPIFIEDTLSDAHREGGCGELVQIVLADGVRSFMHLPILIHEEVFGIFNVCFAKPRAFGEEERRLFWALAQRVALAIENARLYESAQMLAVMEERNRLARDLHDSAKQKAFASLAQLGAARGLVERAPEAARASLEEAEGLVHEVLQELIILIQELHPVALKEHGLAAALREYIGGWGAKDGVEMEMRVEGERALPIEMEQALYRITQEALSNISRHSGARSAEISLVYKANSVKLCVCDDGAGFDTEKNHTGLGLRSMWERVDKFGGELQIKSEAGKGTRIEVIMWDGKLK